MIEISVIVPVFNQAAYLGEALESLRAQTSPVSEIMVVDDGSTDGSGELARRFGHGVVTHGQEHAGAGAARNRGVREARCPWLAFLDADDLWLPTKIERQVRAIEADPGLDMVFSHLEHFLSPDLTPDQAARLACPQAPMPCTTAGAMLIRRDAFDRAGGFDESGAIGEVVEWYVRARAVGLVESTLPEILVRRRIHWRNTSRNRKPERSRYASIAKRALDRRRASGG